MSLNIENIEKEKKKSIIIDLETLTDYNVTFIFKHKRYYIKDLYTIFIRANSLSEYEEEMKKKEDYIEWCNKYINDLKIQIDGYKNIKREIIDRIINIGEN